MNTPSAIEQKALPSSSDAMFMFKFTFMLISMFELMAAEYGCGSFIKSDCGWQGGSEEECAPTAA